MAMNSDVVSWQQAEDALTAAIEYLGAMPDAERAFQQAGSRSCWPAIVRDAVMDYADGEIAPSARLTRRRIQFVEAMLLSPRAACLAVPEGHTRLVGRVLVAKRWPGPDGFRWERIWDMEGGRACGVTSDALRRRYDRAVGKVALRMTVLRIGLGEIEAEAA